MSSTGRFAPPYNGAVIDMNTYPSFYFRPAKGEQVRTTLYPETEDRGALCARVVDASGAPVPDALALLFRADDTGGFKLLGSACTDAAGFVAFGPLEPETLYYIKLIGGGLQTRELEQP